MGYILPITPYEYINYQKRLENKQNPYQIDVLYKVILETKHNKKVPVYDRKKVGTNKLDKADVSDQISIELTGKGGHLDMEV